MPGSATKESRLRLQAATCSYSSSAKPARTNEARRIHAPRMRLLRLLVDRTPPLQKLREGAPKIGLFGQEFPVRPTREPPRRTLPSSQTFRWVLIEQAQLVAVLPRSNWVRK